MKKAIIVCGGRIEDYSRYRRYFHNGSEGYLIICADSGATHLRKLGVLPHVLIGDFDSIVCSDMEYFRKQDVGIISHPVYKDKTDSELAVEYAIDSGCDEIVIIGGFGSRADHSMANIMLLKKISDAGCKGMLADENNEVYLLEPKIPFGITCGKCSSSKVSLIPLTDTVEGVTTKDLRFSLDNAVIKMGSTLGVSNEFILDGDGMINAQISIKKGLLLVIVSKDS